MDVAVEPGGITHFRALVDTMDRVQTTPEVMKTSRTGTGSFYEGESETFVVSSHFDSFFF